MSDEVSMEEARRTLARAVVEIERARQAVITCALREEIAASPAIWEASADEDTWEADEFPRLVCERARDAARVAGDIDDCGQSLGRDPLGIVHEAIAARRGGCQDRRAGA